LKKIRLEEINRVIPVPLLLEYEDMLKRPGNLEELLSQRASQASIEVYSNVLKKVKDEPPVDEDKL